MSASLVGSEMCIRDRLEACATLVARARPSSSGSQLGRREDASSDTSHATCLLYTSDAADDM
eukprot:14735234-Alexandrium_andersonii.AAC.1